MNNTIEVVTTKIDQLNQIREKESNLNHKTSYEIETLVKYLLLNLGPVVWNGESISASKDYESLNLYTTFQISRGCVTWTKRMSFFSRHNFNDLESILELILSSDLVRSNLEKSQADLEAAQVRFDKINSIYKKLGF